MNQMEAKTTNDPTGETTVCFMDRNGSHKHYRESRHWCMYHGRRHNLKGWQAWNKVEERKWGGTYFDNARRFYGPNLTPPPSVPRWKEGCVCTAVDQLA